MNQPTPEAIHLAGSLREAKIQQLEVACDVPTETPGEAQALGDWLASRWLMPFRRIAHTGRCSTTRYSHAEDRLGWGRKTQIVYSDLPSKVTKTPCAHLEIRWRGCKPVRRGKFRSVDDVLRLDPAAYLREHLAFASVDLQRLGRQFRGRFNAKTPLIRNRRLFGRIESIDLDQLVGFHLARAATAARDPLEDLTHPFAIHVKDHFGGEAGEGWFASRSVIKKIPVGKLLTITNDIRAYPFTPPP